ncbi:MAG TPA: hypothetical protein VLV30_08235 [Methanomicrobiales archaeon]|nr:hypothetical protein [Methanomicrobiales archaeon]
MEVSAPATIGIEVSIDKRLCCNCGTCIDRCSMGVFDLFEDGVCPAKMHLCCTCMKCSDFCPTHAISTRWTVRA